MTIYFGLELDQLVYPEFQKGGIWYCGPKGLLKFLETHLGLVGHPANNEFLRIEQFRQAIQKHASFHENAFYAASFKADPLASATALLERRDELLLGGWDFIPSDSTPIRLKTIAQIENIAQVSEYGLGLSMGFADRWQAVAKELEDQDLPLDKLFVNEPSAVLPRHFERVFDLLKTKNIPIEHIEFEIELPDTDLGVFKTCISQKAKKHQAKADGSIIILKSKRSHSLATFSAKLFQQNRNYRPICLISEKNRTLDNALIQEGLPSLGIASESLARPSLQILKLVTAFLWKPIDLFKVMEFLSLKVKPLNDFEVVMNPDEEEDKLEKTTLSNLISGIIAKQPGLGSALLIAKVNQYFNQLSKQAPINVFKEIQFQYNLWFRRNTYDLTKTVVKDEVTEIFKYVARWARDVYNEDKSKPESIMLLSEQAKRIVELLETLPPNEVRLNFLQLERIVRTVYEPSPLPREKQVGYLEYVHHSSAFIEPLDNLFWWNFLDNEPPYFFSKWYQNETKYLKAIDIELETPKDQNRRLIWQRTRPVLYAKKQVVFCLPHMVDGTESHPHPLMGNLSACFENLESIIVDIDQGINLEWLSSLGFEVAPKINLDYKPIQNINPYIHIEDAAILGNREIETYTSLSSLIYYPHIWALRYIYKLQKSSILSIVKGNTLKGLLAHKVFELLFKENEKTDVLSWDKAHLTKWVESTAMELLRKEGVVLLMYGKEPERASFINKLKFSANTLINMIRTNDWTIEATEKELDGELTKNKKIEARADLVLKRGDSEKVLLDLKWRGARYRYELIRNQEDLQLVIYSKLLGAEQEWAHTSYYIIEQGKMIARNNVAFKEAEVVPNQDDITGINNSIWSQIIDTYLWRMEQMKAGKIEVRSKKTRLDLEEDISEALKHRDLLEMKRDDNRFDDFKTLIGQLE